MTDERSDKKAAPRKYSSGDEKSVRCFYPIYHNTRLPRPDSHLQPLYRLYRVPWNYWEKEDGHWKCPPRMQKNVVFICKINAVWVRTVALYLSTILVLLCDGQFIHLSYSTLFLNDRLNLFSVTDDRLTWTHSATEDRPVTERRLSLQFIRRRT